MSSISKTKRHLLRSRLQQSKHDKVITKNQSSQWQKVANVSEEEFEEHIAGDVAKGKAPSSTAILRDEARKQRVENIVDISEGNTELSTEKTYPIIYADPPWRYENPPVGATNRAIENHSPHIFVGGVSPSGKLIGGSPLSIQAESRCP